MLNKKNIYITGSFMESHLFYLIPILIAYSKKNKIYNWLFEKSSHHNVLNSSTINSKIKNFKITKVNYTMLSIFDLISIKVIFYLIWCFFFLNRKNLLKKKDFFFYQIKHAYWDSCLQFLADDQLDSKYFSLSRIYGLKACLSAVLEYLKIKNNKIHSVFTFHNVYKYRILIAIFRKKNIPIFCYQDYSIFKLPRYYDVNKFLLKKKEWNTYLSKVTRKEVYSYWDMRSKGFSTYDDAQVAFNNNAANIHKSKNIIFLHIFKDSPFNDIDGSRIFSDYFDWVAQTLKIIEKTTESWTIRVSPSAKKWGENQFIIINRMISFLFKNFRPKNIIVDNGKSSNFEILKHAKRVVTYRGTVHIEAACHGIKPIVISNVSLSSYNPKLVHKPKSIEEYEKLILEKKMTKFKLHKKEQILSKKILYIREKLLDFRDHTSKIRIYRNSSKKELNNDLNLAEKCFNDNYEYFNNLGKNL